MDSTKPYMVKIDREYDLNPPSVSASGREQCVAYKGWFYCTDVACTQHNNLLGIQQGPGKENCLMVESVSKRVYSVCVRVCN